MSDAPVVLKMCRFSPQKRIETFLDAAAKIRLELPDTQFVLVGTAKLPAEREYEVFVRERIKQLRLEDAVLCPGEKQVD